MEKNEARRDPVAIVMNYTDEELMEYRYTVGGTDGLLAQLESQRRLKNAIAELNKSTKKFNTVMIALTIAILVLAIVQVAVVIMNQENEAQPILL